MGKGHRLKAKATERDALLAQGDIPEIPGAGLPDLPQAVEMGSQRKGSPVDRVSQFALSSKLYGDVRL